MSSAFEFCICHGSDTEFCPFHDPKILALKESKKQEVKEEENEQNHTSTV